MPMISRRRIIFATVLSCCCLGAADEACSQSDPSASERQETLKLAVIGASASAGFGIVVEVEKASPPETDETVTSDAPTAPRTVKRMIKLIDLLGSVPVLRNGENEAPQAAILLRTATTAGTGESG